MSLLTQSAMSAHATGQDAAHRLVAADADGAERAVVVGDHGHAAVVGLDERPRRHRLR